jgi:hypothetical protein
MNMKKMLQPILIAAGMALVATAAQANPSTPIGGTPYNSLEQTIGTAPSFYVTSEAYAPNTGINTSLTLWEYIYITPATGTGGYGAGAGIANFAVNLGNITGVTGENAPASWQTGVLNASSENITWNSNGGDQSAQVTFTFLSPYSPVWGYATANDNGPFSDIGTFHSPTLTDSGVVVPNAPAVPDGGLTLALLGVSLVGIQALRRKMA